MQNDFIGSIGSYDFYVLFGAPQERLNYMKIIRPFDNYVWACIFAALVFTYLSLVLINKIYAATSSVNHKKETPYQSMYQITQKIFPVFPRFLHCKGNCFQISGNFLEN